MDKKLRVLFELGVDVKLSPDAAAQILRTIEDLEERVANQEVLIRRRDQRIEDLKRSHEQRYRETDAIRRQNQELLKMLADRTLLAPPSFCVPQAFTIDSVTINDEPVPPKPVTASEYRRHQDEVNRGVRKAMDCTNMVIRGPRTPAQQQADEMRDYVDRKILDELSHVSAQMDERNVPGYHGTSPMADMQGQANDTQSIVDEILRLGEEIDAAPRSGYYVIDLAKLDSTIREALDAARLMDDAMAGNDPGWLKMVDLDQIALDCAVAIAEVPNSHHFLGGMVQRKARVQNIVHDALREALMKVADAAEAGSDFADLEGCERGGVHMLTGMIRRKCGGSIPW